MNGNYVVWTIVGVLLIIVLVLFLLGGIGNINV